MKNPLEHASQAALPSNERMGSEDRAVGARRRILLVLPEISARRGGGIGAVGRSLMKLLDCRQRTEPIEYRVLAMGTPDEDQVLSASERARLWTFGGFRGAMAAAIWAALVRWADLAIFSHVGLASVLAAVPRGFRPRIVTWIHGREIWGPIGPLKRLALRESDLVVSNTEFTASKARSIHPWLPPTTCCHLGIPLDSWGDAPEAHRVLGFWPSRHDILLVGRIAKGEGGKGHRELIAAMDKIIARVPEARLVLVGGGDDLDTYRRLARQSRVGDRIHLTGYVAPQVRETLYRHSGLLAMPSRQDGFGLVYLEAMRAGLPCVASRQDGGQEVVLDGETGLLVDRADGTSLVEAVVRLLQDDELRRRLGEQGRARFERDFTEERFHARFWRQVQ